MHSYQISNKEEIINIINTRILKSDEIVEGTTTQMNPGKPKEDFCTANSERGERCNQISENLEEGFDCLCKSAIKNV